MKPLFACADFTFPLLEHEKALKLISLLDFQEVDIGLFEKRSHIQPSTEFSDISKNAKKLKKTLKSVGLNPADVFLQCDTDFSVYAINQPDEDRRDFAADWFKKLIEYTQELGGKHATILPGVHFEEESFEDSFARMCEELAWRVDYAAKQGITLSTEAHFGSIVQNPKDAKRMVESVPGLTLTLDYTHFVRIGAPQEEMDDLVQFASHFHARCANKEEMQTVFAQNVIDYSKVVAKMKETNYAGFIGIEYYWNEWENGNRVDNVSETVIMRSHLTELFNKSLN